MFKILVVSTKYILNYVSQQLMCVFLGWLAICTERRDINTDYFFIFFIAVLKLHTTEIFWIIAFCPFSGNQMFQKLEKKWERKSRMKTHIKQNLSFLLYISKLRFFKTFFLSFNFHMSILLFFPAVLFLCFFLSDKSSHSGQQSHKSQWNKPIFFNSWDDLLRKS